MKHLYWAAATVVAFALGLYLGGPEGLGGPAPAAPGSMGLPAGPIAAAPLQGAAPAADPLDASAARGDGLPAGTPWDEGLDLLDVRARRGADTGELRRELLSRVRAVARDGDSTRARTMLDAYLRRNPHDPEAYLLDSDLRQMAGRARQALSPLLALLEFADEPEVVTRARDRLRLLVNAEEARLSNTGDVAALIRLFEDLTQRDASFDGHRLRLAHWQLRAGQLAAAERTLAETGSVGVEPGAREDLEARLRVARTSLPLEQRDGALHVTATDPRGGRALRLLVDTGATTTALTRSGAAGLGAVPTGKRVRVRTANGIVESEVHRVPQMEIGSLRLESLAVLVLDGPLPQGVDGLLGMDVLSRFPGVPGMATRGAEVP